MFDWLPAIALASALPWAAQSFRRLSRLLHILQLEEYDSPRLARWLRGNSRQATPLALAALLPLAAVGALAGLGAMALVALFVIWAAVGGLVVVRQPRVAAKKPLVLTPKALLLVGSSAIVWLLVAGGLWLALRGPLGAAATLGLVLGIALADALLPALLLGANLALYPVQGLAKVAVVEAARLRLRRSSVRVVGITGSYGKTSTKEVLATLLAAKGPTLKTPESYNTPLGISKVVLRRLRPEHERFVVEMGAYRRGDIRGLCRIAGPEIGILTAVNPQHLERFGSIENIAAAKYELIESLPDRGVAIFNNDNPWCRKLADQTAKSRPSLTVLRYGLDEDPAADLVARNVRVTRRGLEFEIEARGRGSVTVQVGLLGRHNVSNVLGATAAALACGMTLGEIGAAAGSIKPVPHRLQLIEGSGGVTVIDDAYNANPDGARAALEVLGQFEGGHKVLVTPGMIELGEREAEENRAFGERAAKVCDAVILVGAQRTAPIHEGLLGAGYPEGKITVVRGIGEVPGQLSQLVSAGDVVLFENDLPDNYSE